MEAQSLRVAKVFSTGGDVHYILPHFQREYAWEKKHWLTLMNDIFNVYDVYDDSVPGREPEHFLGTLVVINDGTRNGTVPALKLVDGQQRLITISLILCALGRVIQDTHVALYRKIQRFLTNTDEDGDLRLKLLPTKKYADRIVYEALVEGREVSIELYDSAIPRAFDFLYRELRIRISNGCDPDKLFRVISNCLHVVFITLDQQEKPYEIFESLNAKNKPLTQADLVRNYIAMKLSPEKQEWVFEEEWAVVDYLLQEKRTVGRAKFGELTSFLRHYLAFRIGVLINEEHVYARFRDHMKGESNSEDAFIEEICTLKRFAQYYDYLLRPQHEPDEEIRERLLRLARMEIATAYPFLLAMYEKLYDGIINITEFLDGLEVLENYTVRRYLVGEQTNYTNKMFPILCKEVDFSDFSRSLRQKLLIRNYPSDYRIRQLAPMEPLYDGRSQTRAKISLVLETINRELSIGSGGYTVLDDAPTVEHIMPQSYPEEWQAEFGEDQEGHRVILHTLGNLTLVSQDWNTVLSNANFSVKRRKLATHALLLNRIYFGSNIERWNRDAIMERADTLIDHILQIWPSFGELPEETSSDQRPKAIVVLGETKEVKSWRDVAEAITESIIDLVDDFDSIANKMPNYFVHEPRHDRFRQLSNGWYLNVNLGSSSSQNFCRSLTTLAELSEDDWDIVMA